MLTLTDRITNNQDFLWNNFILCILTFVSLEKLVCFSAGFRFEVFNLDTKMLIGRTHLHEPVSFWTWLNSDIIAIVTDTAVFHWDLWQGSKLFMVSTSTNKKNEISCFCVHTLIQYTINNSPRKEARVLLCLPRVWNLRAVSLIPLFYMAMASKWCQESVINKQWCKTPVCITHPKSRTKTMTNNPTCKSVGHLLHIYAEKIPRSNVHNITQWLMSQTL